MRRGSPTSRPSSTASIGFRFTPAHYILGRYPDYVRKNYRALVQENGGDKWDDWADAVLMFQAFDDPRAALRQFSAREKTLPIDAGNSRAHLYHWLHSLDALGSVKRSVTADYPLYAVFRKGEKKAYVVHNLSVEARKVTFSDGTTMTVRPRSLEVSFRGSGG